MNIRITVVLLLSLIAFVMIPSFSCAQEFRLNDNELAISFDTDTWTVFTKENLEKNKRALKKLGTTPAAMKSTMEKSNSHLVAIKNARGESEEVLVRIQHNAYVNNMSTLSERDMKAFKKGLIEIYSSEIENLKCRVFETDGVKWIKMTGHYDETHRVIQYFTIINGKEYLVSAQKIAAYTAEDKAELEEVISSTQFVVDETMTDNDIESYIKERQEALSNSGSIQTKVFAGIAIVLAVAAVLYLKNRKHRKKRRCGDD